jgi:hypothetical protein
MKLRCKHIARIACLAFLLNALLPFFAVYEIPHQSSPKEMSSLFGEKVLICSGDGFKWVTWADLESGKEKHTPSSHYKCPLCYVAAHGMKDMVTPDAVTLASIEAADSVHAIYDYQPAAFYLQSPFSSRAPPYSSLS